MSEYRDAKHLQPLVDRLIKRDFPELVADDVQIGVRTVHAATDDEGVPKGPALKHGGYQAAAVARIVPQKDRVKGLPDGIIDVDGDRWDEWSERRQEAILVHELMHFRPTGKTDACGRPKLKMRLHDFQCGGFTSVVEKYGHNAPEAEIFQEMTHAWSQRLFKFMEEEKEEVA